MPTKQRWGGIPIRRISHPFRLEGSPVLVVHVGVHDIEFDAEYSAPVEHLKAVKGVM